MNNGCDTPISELNLSPPESFSRALRAEFYVLRRMIIKLEERWREIKVDSDANEGKYEEILDETYEIKLEEIESLKKLNQQIAEKQYNIEKENIESAFEENKKNLFKKMIEGYYDMYLNVVNHLKELMRDDFDDFFVGNEIGFPIMENQKPEKALQPPEEIKFGYTHYDSEKQIKRIVNSAAENKSASTASSTESDGSLDSAHP